MPETRYTALGLQVGPDQTRERGQFRVANSHTAHGVAAFLEPRYSRGCAGFDVPAETKMSHVRKSELAKWLPDQWKLHQAALRSKRIGAFGELND